MSSVEAYGGQPPEFLPVDVINEKVASAERQLLGMVGPGASDSVRLLHLFMQFGVSYGELRQIVGEF